MIFSPKNTLAFQGARVLHQHRDMSEVPCADVANAAQAFMDKNQKTNNTSPQREALWFYGLNHGVALISTRYDALEPLPDPILAFLDGYHVRGGEIALRAFYYLLLITTREARHVKQSTIYKIGDGEYATGELNWIANSPNGSHEAYKRFLNSPPAMTIGRYTKMVRDTFYEGKFSSGYGGEAWGHIADCLVSFVDGTYSAEMMMDTVWTLAHNGGPCFDKGMLYSGQSTSCLLRILDIQRAGMIPESILSKESTIESYTDPELLTFMKFLKAEFPTAIPEQIDWIKLQALGAKGNYHHEITNQKKSDPQYKAKEAAAKIAAQQKLEAAAAAIKAKEAAEALDWYQVDMWTKVKKIQVERKVAA